MNLCDYRFSGSQRRKGDRRAGCAAAGNKGNPFVPSPQGRKNKAVRGTKGCHEILAGKDLFGAEPAPGPRRLGYARISTDTQDAALQRAALAGHGCHALWTEQVSGAAATRPVLDDLLREARRGDVLVVWSLDRLARSLRQLLDTVAILEARGIELQALTQAIDTASPAGRLTFQVLGAVAEFERAILRQRTTAGMKAARAAGVHVGRRPALTLAQRQHAAELAADGKSNAEIARVFAVSKETVRRHLKG
ncbi:recombinase family protein [Roseomonas sp. GCM10028921]